MHGRAGSRPGSDEGGAGAKRKAAADDRRTQGRAKGARAENRVPRSGWSGEARGPNPGGGGPQTREQATEGGLAGGAGRAGGQGRGGGSWPGRITAQGCDLRAGEPAPASGRANPMATLGGGGARRRGGRESREKPGTANRADRGRRPRVRRSGRAVTETSASGGCREPLPSGQEGMGPNAPGEGARAQGGSQGSTGRPTRRATDGR